MKTPTINAAIERVMSFHLPIIAMLLGVSGAGCIPNPRLAPGLLDGEFVRPPLVRVRLADTSATYIIRSEGRFLIRGFRNDSSPSNYSTTGPIQAGFNAQNKIDIQDDGGVQLDTSLSGIWVHPADSANRMWINDKPFYGALIIGRNARGKSRLVNRLNLDDPIQAGCVNDNAAMHRHGAAGKPAAGTAWGQRNPLAVGDADNSLHFHRVGGSDHQVGHVGVVRLGNFVMAVWFQRLGIAVENMLVAHNVAQFACDGACDRAVRHGSGILVARG